MKIINSICIALLCACGAEVRFADGFQQSEAPPQVNPPPPAPPNGNPGNGQGNDDVLPIPPPSPQGRQLALTWEWPCRSQSDSGNSHSLLGDISGEGLHEIAMSPRDSLVLTIDAEVCRHADAKRDIVFIVDVSGSMVNRRSGRRVIPGNDPVRNNNCQRRVALQGIRGQLEDNEHAQMALVTFNNQVQVTTQGFLSALDIAGQFSVNNLCAGSDGTNYTSALEAAEQILVSGARAHSSREVYFVSDGLPDPPSANGVEAAARIRDPNGIDATIATLMFRGNDTVLRTLIASQDEQGQPLHASTNDAGELLEILTDLSKVYFTSAIFRLRALDDDSTAWQEFDLIERIEEERWFFDFSNLNLTDYPEGLQFEFQYRDNRDRLMRKEGRIRWTKAP